jgi:hypothetical protein
MLGVWGNIARHLWSYRVFHPVLLIIHRSLNANGVNRLQKSRRLLQKSLSSAPKTSRSNPIIYPM